MNELDDLMKNDNWISISCYEYLTENFIEEYRDKLDWYLISYYQNLSKDFIKKYEYKFNSNYLSHNIIFDKSKHYNICKICCSIMYDLSFKDCNETIMDCALK